MADNSLKILIVEDNPADSRLCVEALTSSTYRDFEPIIVETLSDAVAMVPEANFDVVLLDLGLPDAQGLEAVERMRAGAPDIPIVVTTGLNNTEIGLDAIRAGATDFTLKDQLESPQLVRTLVFAVERHTLREQLREARRRELATMLAQFYSLIEDNADAIIVIGEGGIAHFINPAGEELLGRKASDIIGTMIGIPMETDHQAEIELLRPNGTEIVADMHVMPTLWHNEKAYVATLRDISQRKKTENDLRVQAEEAERATKMKSAFLANMSHELRTPLNSIIGFADLINAETFGPLGHDKYIEYSEIISKSGNHLLSLINDLLDLSKAEADKIDIYETQFDFDALVRDCIATITPAVKNANLRVKNAVSKVSVMGDEKRLKQVLLNLLSNAVKFTDEGGEISLSSVVKSDGSLSVSVSDSGIGIAKDDLPKVFGKFVQVGPAYVADQVGTGLGLSLCKSFVELHGGTIKLDSEEGVGTTVTFTLPSERIHDAAVIKLPNQEERRLRQLWR